MFQILFSVVFLLKGNFGKLVNILWEKECNKENLFFPDIFDMCKKKTFIEYLGQWKFALLQRNFVLCYRFRVNTNKCILNVHSRKMIFKVYKVLTCFSLDYFAPAHPNSEKEKLRNNFSTTSLSYYKTSKIQHIRP